ncbi:hypothetical protein BDV23DRAFT_10902 [Aspergillus alliaceus]|uniref:Uncharacterized protein n=1 Tax=Petromyces alliaceus TaxID=209559 RepID=A0A5N7CJ87_PETAA|nr:hypothetical protein BDV23DRAFT_10902 [Aspergillus alliaceus]
MTCSLVGHGLMVRLFAVYYFLGEMIILYRYGVQRAKVIPAFPTMGHTDRT